MMLCHIIFTFILEFNVPIRIDNVYIKLNFTISHSNGFVIRYIKNIQMIKGTFLLALLCLCTALVTYDKFMVSDPDAFCLDGSKPAYFLKKENNAKWVITFQGGGWCGSPAGLSQTVEDCYQRSKTDLGSTKTYPANYVFSQQAGLFGDHPQNYYKDWTIVYFKYCTGTGHQGYKKEAIQYKDTLLYFRGHNATIGMLNSLVQNHNFKSAQQVVVTGLSAGGLATFVWSQYIADFAGQYNIKDVRSLPDSGIFLDQMNYNSKKNDYKETFLNFMKLSNQGVDPPNKACVQANPNQVWKCMFAQYNQVYITIPLFAIQSPYDTWCIPYILGLFCEKGGSLQGCKSAGLINIVEEYHQNATKVLRAIGSRAGNGYWAPSCANHCYTFAPSYYDNNYRIPARSQFSLANSITNWMNKTPGNHSHEDSGNWPSNSPCSGLSDRPSNLEMQ